MDLTLSIQFMDEITDDLITDIIDANKKTTYYQHFLYEDTCAIPYNHVKYREALRDEGFMADFERNLIYNHQQYLKGHRKVYCYSHYWETKSDFEMHFYKQPPSNNKNKKDNTIVDPLTLSDEDFIAYLERIITNKEYLEIKGITYSICYKPSLPHLKLLFTVYENIGMKPLYGSLMFHYVLSSEAEVKEFEHTIVFFSSRNTQKIITPSSIKETIDYLLQQYVDELISMVPTTENTEMIMYAISKKDVDPSNMFIAASAFKPCHLLYFCEQCKTHGITIPNFNLSHWNEFDIDYKFWIDFYGKSDNTYKVFFTNKQIKKLVSTIDLLTELLTHMINNEDKNQIKDIIIDLNVTNIFARSFITYVEYITIIKFIEFVRENNFDIKFQILVPITDIGDFSIENLLGLRTIGELNKIKF